MAQTRIIKKYPNRRLYDTDESRYITIEDVRKLVIGAIDFKVIDTESQEDLTRNTLIQIIIEQELGNEPLFTTDMLTKFIRLSQDTAQDVFSDFLEQSTRFFVEQQQVLREQMQNVLSGKQGRTFAEITQRNFELWRNVQENFLKSAGFTPSKSNENPEKKDKK